MRRLAALSVLLAASLAWLLLWGSPVVGQPPSGALQPFGGVRIIGRHNQVANVTHTGQLSVDATVTATVTTDNVNVFHQSTIRHVSSVTHVAGTIRGFGRQETDVVGPNALAHLALRTIAIQARSLKRHAGALHITTASHILNGIDGKRLYVYAYSIQSRVDNMRMQLVDNNTAHVTLLWKFNAREGTAVQPIAPPSYLFATSPGNALVAHVMATTPTISGNYTVDYDISWFEDD